MDQRMSRQVQRALQVPLHRRVRRVEAREYIETFERTDRRSQVLHEFARLDFNMVQTIHQRELRELSGWWRDLGLGEHISFARDRLVESYFMAVGKMHEPQFSQYRMQLARVSYLMATVEDIFSEHQSVEELERFVQVVERWDLQAAEQLPQSLRVFYAAVYNTTNQISYTVLRRHGRDITSHMRRAWVSVCRAYLVEARWHRARQTPRLEEYLSNIRAAMTGPILLPAYFFLSQNIEEQAIQQLQNDSNIINFSSMIVRLSADLQRSRLGIRSANIIDDAASSNQRDKTFKGAKSTEHNTLKITSKLNGPNYLSWAKAARLFLSGTSKISYINGKTKAPATTDPSYDQWESEKDMVMAWLLNSMEPSIANLFTYQDTAHGIWEALKERYSEQNNLDRVYQIQCKIASLTLHDQDMQRKDATFQDPGMNKVIGKGRRHNDLYTLDIDNLHQIKIDSKDQLPNLASLIRTHMHSEPQSPHLFPHH
ncbi:alpha-thujene synthase, chloroplastic-like [Nymphaea colorata]|nr:alpha-thujene synthase, chloroplastic-like [Nymphaea colorata]